jgi:hypothetical protein
MRKLALFAFLLPSLAFGQQMGQYIFKDASGNWTSTKTLTTTNGITSENIYFTRSYALSGDVNLLVNIDVLGGSMVNVTVTYRKLYAAIDDSLKASAWYTLGTITSAAGLNVLPLIRSTDWSFCDGIQFKFTPASSCSLLVRAEIRVR